jgi:hypothetical protein
MPEPDDFDPADEDQDDLEDDGQEDEDQEDDGDEDKPYEAPDAETWAKVQRKIKRQEDRITRLLAERKTGGKPAPKKTAASDPDAELLRQLRGLGNRKGAQDDDDEDQEDGPDWKGMAIKAAAASQLQAAGFSGTAKQAARLARLIDTSNLVPNRDGTFDLEDEVDELKDEFPELFGARTGRRPAPVVRRNDPRGGTPPKDPTRATDLALLKEAGYR